MQRLELTLPTAAENLALDEALLDWAEDGPPEWECLRIWESSQPVVMVGRSTRVHLEVFEDACRERGIPILRRSSGGAAIVAGPGCLMYAVVLSIALRPETKDIGRAHSLVLSRLASGLSAVESTGGSVVCAGTSDLTLVDPTAASIARKFSGNSLRVKRTHLLYHGTLLYDADLSLIDTCLRMPPRQPDYRDARPHRDFVANLPIERTELIAALDRAWPTAAELNDWPRDRVAALVRERFSQESWNREFA